MRHPYTLTHIKIVATSVRMPQFFLFSIAFTIGVGVALYAVHKTIYIYTDIATIAPLSLIGISIAYFTWTASCITNDIYDIAIDSITNPQRPLPRQIIDIKTYRTFALTANLIALILAYTLGTTPFLLCCTFIAVNHIYNAPPLRLKRIPFIATLLGGLSIQIMIFMGFYATIQRYNFAITYPYTLWQIIFAIVIFSFIIPLKDIKDIDSDRANKVYTLPVLFGTRTTIWFATLAISAIFYMPLFISHTFTLPAFISVTIVLCLALYIIYKLTTHHIDEKYSVSPYKVLAWLTVPALLYIGILLALFL